MKNNNLANGLIGNARTKNNLKAFILTIGILILLLSLLTLTSAAYKKASVAYTQTPVFTGSGFENPQLFDRSMCGAGQDFIMQVSPTGCLPSVVRSDLLEDSNVPVYCPVTAIQINPMIDVKAIDRITFTGQMPRGVQGIGYIPARAALGSGIIGEVGTPILNNLGYAVIVLQQQKNESAMPDFVSGNLTATIKYDIGNAFGVGQAVFYLPEIANNEEWEDRFKQYGFWDGKGYIRAEEIDEEGAQITIYSDREDYSTRKSGDKREIATLSLRAGETSHEIPMPGFNYCLGSMQVKLNGLETPDTRARITVNGNSLELEDEEKFLNNKCTIKDVVKHGITQKATINCQEDSRRANFVLTISPKIKLDIDGNTKEYKVGDRLYGHADGERSTYLAYVGTRGNSVNVNNLFIVTTGIRGNAEALTEEQIISAGGFINRRYKSGEITGSDVADAILNAAKWVTSITEQGLRRALTDKTFKGLGYGETKNIFGKNVKIIGFAEPVDLELDNSVSDYYGKATDDYEEIKRDFAEEKYPETSERTLGEEALAEQIDLEWKAGQMKKAFGLCEEFKILYPDSVPAVCTEAWKLSSPYVAVRDVAIAGKVYRITFDGIIEPSFEEFGAKIMIKNKLTGKNLNDNEPFDLTKNEIIYLDEERTEYIQLLDLDKDIAKIYVKLKPSSAKEAVKRAIDSDKNNLKSGFPDDFGSNYLFTLQQVNLKKVAKVSINPKINYVETKATFPFRIGIEKRNFPLSPEKTKERLLALNSTIEKIKNINTKLGAVVKAGKAACLGTGVFFTAKNFLANLHGTGIARQQVMRGSQGWFDFCKENSGNTKKYDDVNACLLANNAEIEKAVEERANLIKTQNSEMENLRALHKDRDGFLGEDIIKTDELLADYVDSAYKSEVKANLADTNTIKIGNDNVEIFGIVDSISPNTVTLSQARDIQLNSRVLKTSTNSRARDIALATIKVDLTEIYLNSKAKETRENFASKYIAGAAASLISTKKLTPLAITNVKTWAEVKGQFTGAPIDDSSYVYFIKDESDAKEYILVLDNDYIIQQTYVINSDKSLNFVDSSKPNPLNLAVRHFDSKTYRNKYQNPEMKYYEQDPYKGLPALVPFDLQNGWYAAMKSTLPIGGAIKAYDDSGKVSSFWLCNVGSNGREEFYSSTRDDICEQINLGTGQPYNQFPGMSEDASKYISCAIKAIESASGPGVYSAGVKNVPIRTSCGGNQLLSIKVGAPAVNLPDIQCQDFMSPSECNILFNVCDPVICPSSRCDLGGAYPVADVVQSGIAGSLALCLPNFPEVKIPICLSGVHAGLEGYTSILQSYQDCLQTSLKTGQTIGICDEIHSVYMCEFIWRQGLPIVQYAAPKIIGSVLKQNSRGGGEYLGVQDAFKKASDSANFFTQYYAANSFKAFKARSAEGVGTQICEKWISVTTPEGGSLFDALTAPDSPSQFIGRFDEIPYTTTTNPPTSQYKVFYHVYAGKDVPAYYQVYLKGSGSSFFQDTNLRRIVAQGFIPTGDYATNTIDFLAPSGYREMCIVVNGREECGFKQVTTDFLPNYITEKYIASQADNKDIETEAGCVSGRVNAYALLNPNLQSGTEEAINPAIYNRGITRICATDNPGKGTDPLADTKDSRWREVGICSNPKVKCWLDGNSVKNAIKNANIKEGILDSTVPVLESLKDEKGAVQSFDEFVKEILKIEDNLKKIQKINENIDRVFLNNQKGYLTLLRGNAYKSLALAIVEKLKSGDSSATGSYPVFEFEDGLFDANLHYTFNNGEWFWALEPNMRNQKNVKENVDVEVVKNEKDVKFIESLRGRLYSEGLVILMLRTAQNNEGGILPCFLNGCTALSTDTVEMSHERIFSVEREVTLKNLVTPETYSITASLIYFEYSNKDSKWKWSLDGKTWEPIEKYTTKSASFTVTITDQSSLNFLKLLEGKKLTPGAAIIFGNGKAPPIESGASSSASTGAGTNTGTQTGGTSTPQQDITSSWKCEHCGNGLFNVCDEQECIDISRKIGKQCSFEDGFFTNSCIEETGTGMSTDTQTGTSLRCTTQQSCQKVLGTEIIKLAKAKKQTGYDISVLQNTGAKSFECLVLQVAMLESTMLHCGKVEVINNVPQITGFQKNSNPIYCNGNEDLVLSNKNDENSLGVMQVNIQAHPDAAKGTPNVYTFEKNVNYGIDLLISEYNPNTKEYVCNGKTYRGWARALRGYNGWNTNCTQGNPNYVEQVVENREEVASLFPELCGDSVAGVTGSFIAGTKISTPNGETNIEDLGVGDEVYSVNTLDNTLLKKKIIDLYNISAVNTLKIVLNDSTKLLVTQEHPFWDPVSKLYKPIKEFKAGDRVLNVKNGKSLSITINSIESIPSYDGQPVYNLHVDGEFNNYLANGILVHNKMAVNQDEFGFDEFDIEAKEEFTVEDFYVADEPSYTGLTVSEKKAAIEAEFGINSTRRWDTLLYPRQISCPEYTYNQVVYPPTTTRTAPGDVSRIIFAIDNGVESANRNRYKITLSSSYAYTVAAGEGLFPGMLEKYCRRERFGINPYFSFPQNNLIFKSNPYIFKFRASKYFGLDHSDNEDNELKNTGFLRQDYCGEHDETGSCHWPPIRSVGFFDTLELGTEFFAARLTWTKWKFITDAQSLGINTNTLSRDQINFWTYYYYNAGIGGGRDVLSRRINNGVLNDDAYIHMPGQTVVHGRSARDNAIIVTATAKFIRELGFFNS